MSTIRKAAVVAAVAAASLAGGALGASFLGTANAQSAGTSTTVAGSDHAAVPGSPDSPADPSTGGSGAPAARGHGGGPGPGGRTGGADQPDPSKGGHMANGITETLLTGEKADKATAAAKAAVPEATIQRVETDAEGAAYEAHMVKADGTHVTVHLNEDCSVKSVDTEH